MCKSSCRSTGSSLERTPSSSSYDPSCAASIPQSSGLLQLAVCGVPGYVQPKRPSSRPSLSSLLKPNPQNTGNALVLAQLFSVPPHLFTPTRLGYIFTFPFVFSLLAYALGTFLSDWSPKLSARHNHGIFEPEFRMILLIPVSLIGIPALFGFGAYAVTSNVHWVPVSVLYGLIVFAVILAATTSFSYILDSHRSQSVEVSVAYCMLRNFFWFGSSYFFPTWLEVDGPKKMFEAVGGIQLGITVLSIPVYIYGKVIRNWIHQVDPMGKLRLN